MASEKPSIDVFSADDRRLIIKALALLSASEKRAMKSSDGDFVPLYQKELDKIETLSYKFR